jgi:signal transduction histidine kinase
MDLLGFPFARDFAPGTMSVLTLSGYIGLLIGIVAVLYVVENSRLASVEAMNRANRILEREKLVHDMHDGIGSQLVGLTALARLGKLEPAQLVAGLEACLDDLHLIIDCRESQVRPLGVAIGELRMRTAQRCEAVGVELDWELSLLDEQWPPNVTLQVLRSAQEMLSNALRHSGARRIRLRLANDAVEGWFWLSVTDDGVGIAEPSPTRRGRGLNSLRARAQRLGGVFTITSQTPGTRVALRFPLASEPEAGTTSASVGLRFEGAQV